MNANTNTARASILTFPSKSLKHPIARSSWISSVKYHAGFLVAFLKDGGCFIFYGVESHIAGLVLAGTGGRSVGHAFHRLLREVDEKTGKLGKWKYVYEWKEAGKEVEYLRRMLR